MFDFLKSDICLYLLTSAKSARVLIHIYVDNAVAPALAGGAHYEAGCLHDALQGQRGPRALGGDGCVNSRGAGHKTGARRADIAANNNTAHLAAPEIAALCVNTHSRRPFVNCCAHKSGAKAETRVCTSWAGEQ